MVSGRLIGMTRFIAPGDLDPHLGPAPRVDVAYEDLWQQAQAIYQQLQAAK